MRTLNSIVVIVLLTASCRNRSGEVSEPMVLSHPQCQGSCVYMATRPDGTPVVSWCEKDGHGRKQFFFSVFDPRQQRFGPAAEIPIRQDAVLHEEGMPKLSVKGDGTMVAIFETAEPTKDNGWAGSIYYTLGDRDGGHWSAPHHLPSDTAAGKSQSFADLTRLNNGEVAASWLGAADAKDPGGRPVQFARTQPQQGFVDEQTVDARACECCRTAIAPGTGGEISIVYRDILRDSIRDMSIVRSADYGRSFSQPVPFSEDGWVVNGCPHNGPSVSQSGETVYAVWRTGSAPAGVYYGELALGKQLVKKKYISGNGRNIQLCTMPDGSRIIAYSEQSEEKDSMYSGIRLNRVDGDSLWQATAGARRSHAGYPVVRPVGSGRVVVAWTDRGQVIYQTVAVHSINETVHKPEGRRLLNGLRVPVVMLSEPRDASCGMPLLLTVGDTLHYQGKVLGFCSPACRETFESDHSMAAHK